MNLSSMELEIPIVHDRSRVVTIAREYAQKQPWAQAQRDLYVSFISFLTGDGHHLSLILEYPDLALKIRNSLPPCIPGRVVYKHAHVALYHNWAFISAGLSFE